MSERNTKIKKPEELGLVVRTKNRSEGLCERCSAIKSMVMGGPFHLPSEAVDQGNGWYIETHSLDFLDLECNLCSQIHAYFQRGIDEFRHRLLPHRFMFLYHNGPSYPSLVLGMTKDKYGPGLDLLDDLVPQDEFMMCKDLDSMFDNFKLIRSWMGECRDHHKSSCKKTQLQYTGALRLVDCHTRKCIKTTHPPPYLCLSYVWGNGGLEDIEVGLELPKDLPKTIEDTLFVAFRIGIPFVWIDRYCVDQRDPTEKAQTIRNMDKIYSGAELTIIAVAGEDPNFGLPGIRGTPRIPQKTISIGNKTFVSIYSVRREVRLSKWNSRGWTYQESCLSSRHLVFSSTQVYFDCSTTFRFEGVNNGQPAAARHGSSPNAFPRLGYDLASLWLHYTAYYARQLSNPEDILDAFSGILRAFVDDHEPEGSANQFYGLPVAFCTTDSRSEVLQSKLSKCFLIALLWQLSSFSLAKTPVLVRFPSWSWASTKDASAIEQSSGLFMEHDFSCRNTVSDARIIFWHNNGQAVQIAEFTKLNQPYQSFAPCFDLTTWTREMELEDFLFGKSQMVIYPDYTTIRNNSFITTSTGLLAVGLVGRFKSDYLYLQGLMVAKNDKNEYYRSAKFQDYVKIDVLDELCLFDEEEHKDSRIPSDGQH